MNRSPLHRATLAAATLVGALSVSLFASGAPDATEFDPTWYDGRAEVAGYRWTGSRYGEARSGEAVAIFVTEPFSRDRHVKLDDPDNPVNEGDVVTVMKLNLVRDFQTGIYDYNTMTSVFVSIDDLSALESTFTSAEWCGHVFEEIDVRADAPTVTTHSYFEGESGSTSLPPRRGGLIGDHLLVWARGLRGAPLAAGDSTRLPLLRSSFERRLAHREAAWSDARIERAAELETVEVPAGRFEAITYRIRFADDPAQGVVRIEAAAPHRVLSWSWSLGGRTIDAGELTGSRRLEYWRLNREGQEELRASIGLAAR